VLAAFAIVASRDAVAGIIVIDPTVTINAISEGSATTAAAANHASNYDGPTQFTANYTIAFKPDGTPDLANSSLILSTINYTSVNEQTRIASLVHKDFVTLRIAITGVTFNDDGSVAGFTFSSINWYPGNDVTNNGISGSINLNTGDTRYIASYIGKNSKATYTYDVMGMITPNQPPNAPDTSDDAIFTPLDDGVGADVAPDSDDLPEPSSIVLLLSGVSGGTPPLFGGMSPVIQVE
jgi:hypothetical protein